MRAIVGRRVDEIAREKDSLDDAGKVVAVDPGGAVGTRCAASPEARHACGRRRAHTRYGAGGRGTRTAGALARGGTSRQRGAGTPAFAARTA